MKKNTLQNTQDAVKHPQKLKIFLWLIFLLYLLTVLKLTILRTDIYHIHYDERQINLTLFLDLVHMYQTKGILEFLRLFLGNIGWFVPLGFFLPILLPLPRQKFFSVCAIGFCLSLMIETTQFFTYQGVAEIDDVILNTFGTALGYGFFLCARRIHQAKAKPPQNAPEIFPETEDSQL